MMKNIIFTKENGAADGCVKYMREFETAEEYVNYLKEAATLVKASTHCFWKEKIGATGFEPATSCSQDRRATTCATPRTS